MAISKQSKIFDLDGQPMVFNFKRFQDAIANQSTRSKKTRQAIRVEISEAACISEEAVRNWSRKSNGPSDLGMIKAAAKILCISDWKELMSKYEEDKKMKDTLTNRQQEAAKRIYDAIIDFLTDFSDSDGFNDLWFDLSCDPAEREDKLYDIVEAKHAAVYRVCKKEYFDLHDSEIYEDLCNYVNDDLYDIFSGKLSYGYRFEATGEAYPTTEDDYYAALTKVNAIISKYL